jgi:hypothetical protein
MTHHIAMSLHDGLEGLDTEKVMGLFRGLVEASPREDALAPDVLFRYPALDKLAAHTERIIEETHTPHEAELVARGMLLGMVTLARYAQTERPGSDKTYPIV